MDPRIVFSGFRLGVGASLLLLALFTFAQCSIFYGFHFLNPNVSVTTTLSDRSENVSIFDFGGLSEKPHGGKGKNASFLDSNGGESVTKRTHEGIFSEIEKGENFLGEEGRFSEKKTSDKNSIERVTGSSVKTQEVESVEKERNGGFLAKFGGFGNVGTGRNNMGTVSGNGGSVKLSILKKPNEGNSSKENKFASSFDGSGAGIGVKCDLFDGRWVRDEGKPYYPAGSCPHIDRVFDCYLNGRPDDDFVRWRWQPNHCDIPSLNATDFLERLRGKKLVFVGDSLNRNMWESLVCILRHSVPNKKNVNEISGREDFKKNGFYAFRYEDYNCSLYFFSSPFLVRQLSLKNRNGSSETLRLDLMDRTASMYRDADVMVFNTGHWWSHDKTSKGENYYQEGNHLYPRLKVMEAYTKALTTWARWIDKNIDAKRTQVFIKGLSVTHFRGGQWNSGGKCHKETEPILNERHLGEYPLKMKVLEHVLEKMSTPVVYMNISKLTDYRKDAHPSVYKAPGVKRSQDCSHWCLPGIPDTWNELLYASLLRTGSGSWRK